MFMNLAHRGASSYAPENTLSAFYKGIELGANGIETDIKMTKDGILFLHHDDVLERTTNGQGLPREQTWDELKRLDAGSWFAPQFKEEKLVSFEQFLYFFGNKDLVFSFELKDRNIEGPVLELISRYVSEEKVTITSFNYDDLVNIRKRNPNIQLGYLVKKINSDNMKKGLEIKLFQICPKAEMLQLEDVHYAKGFGLKVRAWGVRNEQLMQHAIQCGTDGMTINFPEKLATYMNR